MNYWQIAAGSDSRDYSQDFLRYGLAFVGGKNQITTMQQVNLGDRVILKRGVGQILAAGTVVERDGPFKGVAGSEDKAHGWLWDYDGWDLRGYCHVEWHRADPLQSVTGLTRGTIKQVHASELRAIADDIIQTAPVCVVSPEPAPTVELKDDEMLSELIKVGLRPADAEDLTGTLRRIRLLANYYYYECRWVDVREHEARTFLIIPFLIALGWSEQQLKIELGVSGGRIDIAGFRRPYRRDKDKNPNNEDCVLILESKGFSQGLDYAHAQGKAYATQFPNCQVVVASNGYCYKAYRRKGDGSGFEETPTAYLNLLRPRKSYPLDPGKANGGLELLSHLMPQRR